MATVSSGETLFAESQKNHFIHEKHENFQKVVNFQAFNQRVNHSINTTY